MRPLLALTLVAVAGSALWAQDGGAPPATFPTAAQPPAAQPPVAPPPAPAPAPGGPLSNPLIRRLNNPFAQPTEAGGVAAQTFNENFDGDFGGVFYKRLITTGFTTRTRVIGFSQRVTGFNPVTTTTTTTDQLGRTVITRTTTNNPIIVNDPITVTDTTAQQRLAALTLAARYSGVLITDNDNPRPRDRVYGGFNFYDDMGGSLNPGLGGADVQRQMIGFEKTFLDGDASFGMRLPFVQQYGPAQVRGTNNLGDLSLIGKYALYNDRESGDLWSVGFVLTVPTGSGNATLWDGRDAPHSVLFQPWTGFVRTAGRAYVQGITSLVIPTDGRDPTLWNNSLAAGYYLYRSPDSWLTSVVPTAEVHVRTPLNNRETNGSVFLQDQVNLTGGIHFRFGRAVLSTAVCVPVVGPRPWNYELMSFVNLNF
jgi:hypothetical protein